MTFLGSVGELDQGYIAFHVCALLGKLSQVILKGYQHME
jgi:hypothetical protein